LRAPESLGSLASVCACNELQGDLRTGAHEGLAFNPFAMRPYIGDGSPVVQSFWVDDLVAPTARP